jgi:hypothetical protein
MTIHDKLQQFRKNAERNELAVPDDLTDLSPEVEVLCDAVEMLAEAVERMRCYQGAYIVTYSDRTLNRLKTLLGVRDV